MTNNASQLHMANASVASNRNGSQMSALPLQNAHRANRNQSKENQQTNFTNVMDDYEDLLNTIEKENYVTGQDMNSASLKSPGMAFASKQSKDLTQGTTKMLLSKDEEIEFDLVSGEVAKDMKPLDNIGNASLAAGNDRTISPIAVEKPKAAKGMQKFNESSDFDLDNY